MKSKLRKIITDDSTEKMTGNQEMEVCDNIKANQEQGESNGAAQKTFQERLNDIPMYTMSLNQLCSLYGSLRDRNEVLKKAFVAGEYYAKSFATSAKPVVVNATNSALAAAKPVIGEVSDPGAKLDSFASKTLAEVEKKFPAITKTPAEIAESTKEAIKSTASSCIEKLQGTTPVQIANKQVDNVISLSELMVEICFPTDGSCPEDLAELEKEEEAENQGAATRVCNLKEKLKHRGTRKLMAMKPVVVGVDAVHYAQQRIEEMNEKLGLGTYYVKEKASEAKTFVIDKKAETEKMITEQVTKTNALLKENANKVWENVYSTTMYIPSKAIKISGEVFVSTKEIVFAFSQAHSVVEIPLAIVEMMDKYFASLKETAPQMTDLADKAVGFVVVPAQVVSEYICTSRPVKWIIPSVLNADQVKIMEIAESDTDSSE